MPEDAEFHPTGFLNRCLAWLQAAAESGRLSGLDRTEIDHIAREFGLSAGELTGLARGGGRASELLHRMIRASGLSYEELRRSHPDVVRDLEIHCSLCTEQRRCRRELDSGDAPEGLAAYCPNAPTFVELQAAALQRLA